MDLTLHKRNYYCLVAGLPDLFIGESKPALTNLVFKNELLEQLHSSDYKLAELLYLQYDNRNLINHLLKKDEPVSRLGNYSIEYLEEQMKEPTDIADYLKHFIHVFKDETKAKSALALENHLQGLYFNYVLQSKNRFLKQWFNFDRDMKNILSALNCRKYGYDTEDQLTPSEDENEVYELLMAGHISVESLSEEVPLVDKMMQIAESDKDISEKEKAFDTIKWGFIDEHTFFNYFTIEKILGFVIKLGIVERWAKLDNDTGKAFFERLINDIKMSYRFDDDFSVKRKMRVHSN